MSKRCFCIMRAEDFKNPNYEDRALRQLMEGHVGSFSLEHAQVYAWREELSVLRGVALAHPNCTIALEYMIPRMGKRVDAMVLIDDSIFVVEFKVGEHAYPAEAVSQVLDYAYDLKNFHKDSHDKYLFPVLCCTNAPSRPNRLEHEEPGICNVQLTNGRNLNKVLNSILASRQAPVPLNHDNWLSAVYNPTPTIVEAAQALYVSNEVEDISRNEAGLTNITTTTECVERIVSNSKLNRRKSICFITGVPGAGKTLVGLNLASKRRAEGTQPTDETAVFLSGNGPLIEVLQASLVKDQSRRDKEACAACQWKKKSQECVKQQCVHMRTKKMIEAEVKTFVQGVHLFREEFFENDSAPHEHVAVFDESQRAWSKDQLSFKMKTRWQNKRIVDMSEPECLIKYMDRHSDWTTMVCLVGGGQEIHQGEAGISEWFDALQRDFPDWDIYASPCIDQSAYLGGRDLRQFADRITYDENLHLSVDMRSFRNKNVAAFAEALVENKPNQARELYPLIKNDYPVYITRDLHLAKEWVRSMTKRPSDRCGIVADSYGQRIRADGVIVPTMDFNAATWFLEGRDNIDSSYYLEIAASEFKIQGLEIDYAIVAWEGDYRYRSGNFGFHRFYGGKWQNVNAEMPQRYLKNGYRVLLTRARQGYVIYVPRGSEYDSTRLPHFYDETYDYLKQIGIEEL